MKKLLALLVAALLIVCASLALAEPVAIKALILPKFESGEMAGDFPGEAQYYYCLLYTSHGVPSAIVSGRSAAIAGR